jgi:DNA-binding beta-propeller fold protein YncE
MNRSSLRPVAVALVLASATLAAACGSDDPPPGGVTPPPPDGGPTPDAPPPTPGADFTTIKPAANDASFHAPFDATPDPKGENVYFTALTALDVPAVFVSPAGGGTPRVLHEGAPLSAPFSIAISEDGKTLYIADGNAEVTAGGDENGAVLTMPVGGGVPTVLAGSAGKNPRGIEVAGDSVYYTGKFDGRAGVFKAPLAGGDPVTLTAGDPLREPSGITVTKSGVVYFVDAFAQTAAGAAVFKVEGGQAVVVKAGFAVGHPAGLAANLDDSALLLSGIDPNKQTDLVVRIKLADASTINFTDTIGGFSESAGLHRAKTLNVYAWADSRANGTGTVYVLR